MRESIEGGRDREKKKGRESHTLPHTEPQSSGYSCPGCPLHGAPPAGLLSPQVSLFLFPPLPSFSTFRPPQLRRGVSFTPPGHRSLYPGHGLHEAPLMHMELYNRRFFIFPANFYFYFQLTSSKTKSACFQGFCTFLHFLLKLRVTDRSGASRHLQSVITTL